VGTSLSPYQESNDIWTGARQGLRGVRGKEIRALRQREKETQGWAVIGGHSSPAFHLGGETPKNPAGASTKTWRGRGVGTGEAQKSGKPGRFIIHASSRFPGSGIGGRKNKFSHKSKMDRTLVKWRVLRRYGFVRNFGSGG